jgi:putative ATPase
VREHGAAEPPAYLQDAHYPGARQLGRGTGYEYPHDMAGGVSDQPLLPEDLRDRRYYQPTDRGFEAKLAERLAALRKRLRKPGS